MIPRANLSFTLDASLDWKTAMPPVITWALSDTEWVMPIGGECISAKKYDRNSVVLLNWMPWGLVIIGKHLPVQLAPSEGSLFWMSVRNLLQGTATAELGKANTVAYDIGRAIVCHALPMLCESSPDTLTPRIVDYIQKHGVTQGEYVCPQTMQPEESLSSTAKKRKRS